jgi:hypothetical protein
MFSLLIRIEAVYHGINRTGIHKFYRAILSDDLDYIECCIILPNAQDIAQRHAESSAEDYTVHAAVTYDKHTELGSRVPASNPVLYPMPPLPSIPRK